MLRCSISWNLFLIFSNLTVIICFASLDIFIVEECRVLVGRNHSEFLGHRQNFIEIVNITHFVFFSINFWIFTKLLQFRFFLNIIIPFELIFIPKVPIHEIIVLKHVLLTLNILHV